MNTQIDVGRHRLIRKGSRLRSRPLPGFGTIGIQVLGREACPLSPLGSSGQITRNHIRQMNGEDNRIQLCMYVQGFHKTMGPQGHMIGPGFSCPPLSFPMPSGV